VPNYSFELPPTEFVDTRVESWQKFPKPDWFVESPEQQWDQLIGVFKNTAPGSADHIDNVDGNQAIYLFAVPQAGFFQDYNSTGGTNGAPSHEFDAKFEVGKSYRLTVGAVGGGGNMVEGASMLASLYYRDASGTNMVPLATAAITYSTNTFPSRTHLIDFDAVSAAVQPGDAWAGKNIGIMFVSTAAPDKAGGYWDLDNVRLSVESISPSIEATVVNGELRLTWQSVAGRTYQVQSSTDFQNWALQGGTQTGSGAEMSLSLPMTGSNHAFFRLRETGAQ
jgi:hypothetical protein